MRREVFDRAMACVLALDGDAYADLFTEDGVLELPFSSKIGLPTRVEGREAIRTLAGANMKRARDAGRRMVRFDPLVVHEGVDPEVLIVELTAHGETATGQPYAAPYVHVYRIRDDQIASLRDYISSEHVAAIVASG